MLQFFYTLKKTDSRSFLIRVLEMFNIYSPEIKVNSYGKPYLSDNQLYFNLSHSGAMTILALSDKEVGVDCEKIRSRKTDAVLRSFPESERSEILGTEDFFRHWTVKESFVKFMGTSIAKELPHLSYVEGVLSVDDVPQELCLHTFEIGEYLVSCCQLRSQPYTIREL
ncbi:MAG: 4'-phosphopantetheinyl transferase superfamily protein [Clostridia bacterium]|nr:4'-phosphopantetheinyl transferase superfamily protein [Clostridia bacterium]